ncbi:MAG: ORF6N domain-containing protein, partial [Bdellovibrionales bacterium]|nr:ORF6N domain-containing protein [Bdellovibrionales bacterium]
MAKSKKARDVTKNLGVQQSIISVRGQRGIIDADLAKLYGTSTKRLKEQLKRNSDRFPKDFVFELTASEKSEVVAKCDHLENLKYSRVLPLA